MIIDIFQPAAFDRSPLDLSKLGSATGKSWHYAASGKAALFHTARALGVTGKMLVPAYICRSVLPPLQRLGIAPVFYDIDPDDLNGAAASIDAVARTHDARAVLLASLYGNPANLSEIETLCRTRGWRLIDDAAQSFGARLDGRWVGTFGDAGFFSFSPGKATAGHMGAFFWSATPYEVARGRHYLAHRIKWLDYASNRQHVYDHRWLRPAKTGVALLARAVDRYVPLYDDEMCGFEESILGGILTGVVDQRFCFRRQFHDEFAARFGGSSRFRVLQTLRGTPNNHKFVIVAETAETAQQLVTHMGRHAIYAARGYPLLTDDLRDVPTAAALAPRVVEMPIENDRAKMDYLFSVLEKFATR